MSEAQKNPSLKFTVRDVVEFLFLPVLTAGVFVLWDLNKSVGTLNVQVGSMIAQNTATEKRVDDLQKRVERLEGIKLESNVANK